MTSNLLTGTLGFERYVRLKYLCNLRENRWITNKNVNSYRTFCILFPIILYLPKLFEVQAKLQQVQCSDFVQNVTGSMLRLDLTIENGDFNITDDFQIKGIDDNERLVFSAKIQNFLLTFLAKLKYLSNTIWSGNLNFYLIFLCRISYFGGKIQISMN